MIGPVTKQSGGKNDSQRLWAIAIQVLITKIQLEVTNVGTKNKTKIYAEL